MMNNILIEVSPGEKRVAITNTKGNLCDFYLERASRRPLLEGIFKGRIVRLEKPMGAAFVNIGIDENVFLDHANGLHEGEEIVIQIAREATSGKPPSARREVIISGSYIAYHPGGKDVRWFGSYKDGRRYHELKSKIDSFKLAGEGWSIRSQAWVSDDARILAEMKTLRKSWEHISSLKIEKSSFPL